MTFEYLKQVQYNDSLDIENIGDVALEVYCDEGLEWLLLIRTSLGQSEIMKCGPFIADTSVIMNSFNFNYQMIEFNERKIIKIIDDFLNNNHFTITQVFFTSADEIKNKLLSSDFKIDIDRMCN